MEPNILEISVSIHHTLKGKGWPPFAVYIALPAVVARHCNQYVRAVYGTNNVGDPMTAFKQLLDIFPQVHLIQGGGGELKNIKKNVSLSLQQSRRRPATIPTLGSLRIFKIALTNLPDALSAVSFPILKI
jgi:hypothetical protein